MAGVAITPVQQVKQLFETTLQIAPALFLKDGHHAPIVLVGYGEGQSDTVVLDITSDEAAEASIDTLAELYQDKCTWFVSMIEMWTLPDGAYLKLGERPSQREDRIECLLIQGASRDGKYARSLAYQVIRNGGLIDLVQHWDEPTHSEQFERALFGKEPA